MSFLLFVLTSLSFSLSLSSTQRKRGYLGGNVRSEAAVFSRVEEDTKKGWWGLSLCAVSPGALSYSMDAGSAIGLHNNFKETFIS
jgi:hypothetical protein